MNLPTRRGFLAAALASWAAAAGARRAAAIEPIVRRGKTPLRLSIAAYSFRDHFSGKLQPPMTLEDFVDYAAELGFDAVELTAYYFKDTSPEYLARLRGRCTRLGLDVSGGAIGNDFCLADADKLKQQIQAARDWIERYALLGGKTIRIFAGATPAGDSEEKARRRCADAIAQACDHAAKFGIYLALENHGGITERPEQMLELVRAVKHDWFGVNLDTGNFRTADPYADLALLAPYAVNVQLKTEIQPRGKAKQAVDPRKIIAILRAANYRGYVVLEYEAHEEPRKATGQWIETLRKALA